MASPKAHCQKSISVTIFTSTAWRTLGLFGAFPTRARSGEGDVPLDRTRVMRIIQIGENKKTHSWGECIGKCTLLPIIFGLWQTSSIFGFFFVSLIFSIFFASYGPTGRPRVRSYGFSRDPRKSCWANLLLRTIRMRSQRFVGVSGVSAYKQTNKPTKTHTFSIWFPMSIVGVPYFFFLTVSTLTLPRIP